MPGEENEKPSEADATAPVEESAAATNTAQDEDGEYSREIREELGQTKPEKPPKEEAASEKPPKEPPEKPAEEPPKSDEDPDRPKGLTPEAQRAFDKRVAREVAKRKDLEDALDEERARVRELRDRLTEADAKRGTAVGSEAASPMLAETEEELDRREDYLWRWERFASEHPDGYEATDKDERSYTAEELRKIALDAREERERWLPRARETLRERRRVEPLALEAYPELGDPKSDVSLEVGRLVRAVPGLRKLVDYKLWVADALAGRELREAEAAEKAKPKPSSTDRPPTAVSTPPKAPPPAPTSGSSSSMSGPPRPKRGRLNFEAAARANWSDDALADAYREASG